jgi:hypothetical protein
VPTRTDSRHFSSKQRQNEMAALAHEIIRTELEGKNGELSQDKLIAMTTKDLRDQDFQPIPASWPDHLINAADIQRWASGITKPFEVPGAVQGRKEYAKKVMASVFHQAKAGYPNIPPNLKQLLLMADAQLLERCIDMGYSKVELHYVRLCFMTNFLVCHVFIPGLRPEGLRPPQASADLMPLDKDLIHEAEPYLTEFFNTIADNAEKLVSTETRAKLNALKDEPDFSQHAVNDRPIYQQANKVIAAAEKEYLEGLLGNDKTYAEKLSARHVDGFMSGAHAVLYADLKDKDAFLHDLLIAFIDNAGRANHKQRENWQQTVQFIQKNLSRINALTEQGRAYVRHQLQERLSLSQRASSGRTLLFEEILNRAERALHPISEGDGEEV